MESSRLGARLSSRFVAGRTIDEALDAAAQVNQQGMAVSLYSLGGGATSAVDAHMSADVYHKLLDHMAARGIQGHISIKLSQLGMGISSELAESVTSDVVRHAKAVGSFVRIDMEGSALTQVTLGLARRLHAQGGMRGAVGVATQACLYRSEADVEQLVADGISVRLCKGFFKEREEIAFPRKAAVDANFLLLMAKLLDSPVYPGIATHDVALINATKRFALEHKIDRSSFEFQMLYGVRRDLQRRMVREGYKVRIYLPFGTEWYPYFMRRLVAQPAYVLFLLKGFFR